MTYGSAYVPEFARERAMAPVSQSGFGGTRLAGKYWKAPTRSTAAHRKSTRKLRLFDRAAH
jgi:hypothetical protein